MLQVFVATLIECRSNFMGPSEVRLVIGRGGAWFDLVILRGSVLFCYMFGK